RRLTAIDAPCPLVTKVHAEAIRYARQGYDILLVGHADHQEVVGTRGEAPESIQVVESPDDIAALNIKDPRRARLPRGRAHADHQEVVGTRGEAPESIQVVESPDDIAALNIKDPSRV